MKRRYIILLSLVWCGLLASAQVQPIDKVKFFTDESMINAILEVPLKTIIKRNKKKATITGQFIATMPEGTTITEQVRVEPRGNFRREYCYLPPLKVKFLETDSSVMHPLKSLKLVTTCRMSSQSMNYVLKEFLIYKMYNILTEKSFRVRLLNLEYRDSSDEKKPIKTYAFFIEDSKDMAARNHATEWKKKVNHTEHTDRDEMTSLAIFEYMIGNTDWAVPVAHNIKFIQVQDTVYSRPVAVPYDFDYCGLVNTEYAVPDPLLNIETVVERVYRGFPRNMTELNIQFKVFNEKKDSIYALINNFELLPAVEREKMIAYLDEFYKEINNPAAAEYIFIKNARLN